MKNYFIKDEALSSVDQDSFGHVDIANNIKNMIEYTDRELCKNSRVYRNRMA